MVSDALAGDSLRLAADNRYGTSAAVVDASRNAGLRINRQWVVTGEDFADALVAGPGAAAAGQILVLVDSVTGPAQPEA
ncbi:MAG: cell wall-binding repeat-containing protein [Euzebya sp.]